MKKAPYRTLFGLPVTSADATRHTTSCGPKMVRSQRTSPRVMACQFKQFRLPPVSFYRYCRLLSRPRFRPSRLRRVVVRSLCLDGCEVRLCDPCARVRPCGPCVPVSRVSPGSPRCLFPGTRYSTRYRPYCHSSLPARTALTVGSQSALSPPRDEDPNGAAPPLLVCERLEPIQFQRGTAHREKLGRAGKIATSLVGQRVSSVVRLLLAAHSQVGGASGQAETSGARRIR